MPNYYEIAATDDQLRLKDGQGTASFTVRYVGERRVEARAQAVAVEGAKDDWFQVEAPQTRNMEPNQVHTFTVNVQVPSGTPAGRYGLRLDALSVDNPDEEYDRGPVVNFEVPESKPVPDPDPSPFPWWAVIAAAMVLVIVGGGAAWWLSWDNGPERVTTGETEPSEPAEEPIRADKTGRFAVSQTWHGDFDMGREVPRGASRSQADFWFRARTATNRSLVPKNGAQWGVMRPSEQPPTLAQIKSVVGRGSGSPEIDVRRLRPGRWIAVRTSEGGYAAFTALRPVGPSPGELRVKYYYWRAGR